MAGIKKIEGKTIVDAKRPMIVRISKADIAGSAKKNPAMCAAARALVREGTCTKARVHLSRVYLLQGDKWVKYATPNSIAREITAFDRGGSFEPGDYKLIPVTPSQREGARAKHANNTDKKRYTGNKRAQHITTGVRERVRAR